MEAWERFLTGGANAAMPSGNFVIASWQRSRAHGINPTGRAAPVAASGERLSRLREDSRLLIAAARSIFDRSAELLAGSRSIMLLTNPDGVVLDVIGDHQTIHQAEAINLAQGGDWREDRIGTNGIGTALATARPAQVHAAEHYCEGIKAWTCAAAPVFEPGTGTVLGVVDISGPPTTYQRTNLNLAIATAQLIEAALAERAMRERMRLLTVCLNRMSSGDAGGLVAIDRGGRLVHATGRVEMPVPVGQRVPGLHDRIAVADWAKLLPKEWRPEWFDPVTADGETIGAMLVVPAPRARSVSLPAARGRAEGSEADPERGSFAGIVGASPAMRAMIERARFLAGKQVPVLIQGETGVGKELLGRAIHGESMPGQPFVVVNCGAVTKDLIGSELFGHVRGAFTGATTEGRPGRFELAHGGILCLDEIGELPLELQPFLLRVLEEGVTYRLGDSQPRQVKVRLVAMTNRDLLAEVAAGRFRRDLYYRISVTRLIIPPLREREDDVLLMAAHFNALLSRRHGVPPRVWGADVTQALRRHTWPGNVRELRNVIESLLLMAPAPLVTLADVAPLLAGAEVAAPDPAAPALKAPALEAPTLEAPTLAAHERAMMERALAAAQGNVAAAARRLGVSRSTLYRKAARFGLAI